MRSLIFVAVLAGAAHAQPTEAPADAGVADAPAADTPPVDAAPAPIDAPLPTPAAPPASIDQALPPPTAALPAPSRNKDAAWLFVGGALAFVTTGVVLAYAANSSEADLEDLYVSLEGNPPVFDTKTRSRYDELVDEGRRYEHLSWASFGVAGGMAVGAAIMFWRSAHEVTPVVTPTTAGVALRF